LLLGLILCLIEGFRLARRPRVDGAAL
jgi:hypothetical protein